MPLELYIFFLFWIGFIGSVVGSFLNVVAYRIPRSMSIAFPASHCPKCNAKIRPWHNIPVLGWIILGGKCKDCHELISIFYPLVEAFTGIIWLLLSILVFQWSNNDFSLWFWYSVGAGIGFSILWGWILVQYNKPKKGK